LLSVTILTCDTVGSEWLRRDGGRTRRMAKGLPPKGVLIRLK